MAFDVVIAGGGFGGLYAARRLERRLPRHSARITAVSDVNFLLYTPLLPGAAAGTLEPRHAVVPLREELESSELLLLGRVTGADAIALRNRALLNLEIAESLPDDEARREYLTFVFVGAGYAGVEGFAELQDYVGDVIDRYPRCRVVGTRWILVEAQDRIMREIPESLAQVASNAGVRTPGVTQQLGLPLTKGDRIDTDATMRVRGCDNVWAIGDAAAVPDPAKHRRAPSPQTCQHAIRQGRRAGSNVAAVLAGRKPRPFRYRTLGVFVDMGRNKAVATILGLKLRGFPAWFAARTYHLYMMPGMGRRVRLGIDWAVGLVFGRASAKLGQLGHPPALSDYLDDVTRAGETPGR